MSKLISASEANKKTNEKTKIQIEDFCANVINNAVNKAIEKCYYSTKIYKFEFDDFDNYKETIENLLNKGEYGYDFLFDRIIIYWDELCLQEDDFKEVVSYDVDEYYKIDW